MGFFYVVMTFTAISVKNAYDKIGKPSSGTSGTKETSARSSGIGSQQMQSLNSSERAIPEDGSEDESSD
jgi:hypothetical protein